MAETQIFDLAKMNKLHLKLLPKISSLEQISPGHGGITQSDVAAAMSGLNPTQQLLIEYVLLQQSKKADLINRLFVYYLDFKEKDNRPWKLRKGLLEDMVELALAELSGNPAAAKLTCRDRCEMLDFDSYPVWYWAPRKDRSTTYSPREKYNLVYNEINRLLEGAVRHVRNKLG